MPGGMQHANGVENLPEWHSIRPWRPTLTLSVREITSVSVTFVLSSPFTGAEAVNTEPSLASLGLSSDDDDGDADGSAADASQNQIVSNVLSKGLSVKVNGIPWQRVLMKIDDEDEAVIILFGLMPGRQYDVELGLLPGERSIRGQITTDAEMNADIAEPERPREEQADLSTSSPADTLSVPPIASTPSNGDANSHPPSRSNGLSPTPSTPALTLEDRRIQLSHALNILNTEHTALTTSLKTARRESQKADAALRSEIEALKRASDRHTATEHRARQKVLALQEAVKQTLAATKDIEALIHDIEVALPGLEQRKATVEKEWTCVKQEAAKVRESREEAERREKRRVEGLQAELAVMANRLEKLSGKREKLEGDSGVVTELEEKLRRLEEERERIESDPYGYEGDIGADGDAPRKSRDEGNGDDGSSADQDSRALTHSRSPERHNQPHGHHPHIVHQRKRHSHPHMHHGPPHSQLTPPKPIGRPEPIQRPQHAARQSLPGHTLIVPGVINLSPHGHKSSAGRYASPAPSSSASLSSSSTPAIPLGPPHPPSAMTASSSNLSSRAPPFEPAGMGRPHQQSTGSGGKSDLNPGSIPFSPRSAMAQASTARASDARGASTLL